MGNLRVRNTNSDLSTGENFTKLLSSGSAETPTNIQPIIEEYQTDIDWAITASTFPASTSWPSGTYTVFVDITSSINKSYLECRIHRVNSSGVSQEYKTSTEGQQEIEGVDVTFTFPSVSWGSAQSTDRFAIEFRWFNDNHGNITVGFYSDNTYVATPWTFPEQYDCTCSDGIKTTDTASTELYWESWSAWNDFTGLDPANVTNIITGNSGNLVDFATGKTLSAQIALSGGVDGGSSVGSIYAGSDAEAEFSGKCDPSTGYYIWYYGTDHSIVVSGLDPDRLYRFVHFADRGAYSDRYSNVIITGADSFTPDSSSGVTIGTTYVTDDTATYCGGNNTNGYVAGFTNIDPGSDGAFTIQVGSDDGHEYTSCIRIQLLSTEMTATLTDGAECSDTVGASATLADTLGDSFSASDSPSATLTGNETLADTTTISDSVSIVKMVESTAPDAVTVSDSPSSQLTAGLTCADGIALTESNGAIGTLGAALSDGISVSEGISALLTALDTCADVVSLSEGVNVKKVFAATLADGVELSDAHSARASFILTVSDSVDFDDSPSSIAAYGVTVSDTSELADTVTTQFTVGVTAADTAEFSDEAHTEFEGEGFPATCSETAEFSDTPGAQATYILTVSDGAGFSDAPSAIYSAQVTPADGLSLSDLVSTALGAGTYPVTCGDGAALSDTPNAKLTLEIVVGDGAAASEALSGTSTIPLAVTDGGVCTTAASGAAIYVLTSADGLTLGELLSALATILRTVSDGVDFSDSAATKMVVAVGEVTVTLSVAIPTMSFTAV